MKALWLLPFLMCLMVSAGDMDHRPQKLAAVRAHSILPESLRILVKRHGDQLFAGIDEGIKIPYRNVSESMVERETQLITEMIDGRAPFSRVIYQMGYVSGLLAVWLNPSWGRSDAAMRGFEYYTNAKLRKFLFVFDGYDAFRKQQDVPSYLRSVAGPLDNYGRLLDVNYARVGGNARFLFDERSAVFGVSSIYFSSLAQCSAQLWQHAWASARGDATRTPFVRVEQEASVVIDSAR